MKATLLFFLFLNSLGFAQENLIGFINGPSITTIKSKYFLSETTFNYCYVGGFEFVHEGSKHLLLKSGVKYEQKGFQTVFYSSNQSTNFGAKSSFNYDYLSVPLNIGYRYGDGNFFGEIFTGISFSGLLSAKHDIIQGDFVLKENETKNATRFDISPTIGLGQGYKFKKGMELVFWVEFQHGLINIANSNYYPLSEIRQKGFYLQLSLRKNITLRKKEAEKHQKQ